MSDVALSAAWLTGIRARRALRLLDSIPIIPWPAKMYYSETQCPAPTYAILYPFQTSYRGEHLSSFLLAEPASSQAHPEPCSVLKDGL